MDLSIIVVNYNVKYFLEQCLYSVFVACEGLDAEVFVVDNASTDGSQEMIRSKFPQVVLMNNTENVGFARANNQAIRKATGRYVLLLNPDTLIEAATLHRCIDFMDHHDGCGGLGVKMIDGSGQFLPESKRGFPSPMVAFYKIFGLSALFPSSKKFGKYYLNYLDNDHIAEIEVLAGAFMMLRFAALEKIGLLDEDFFMYGEDIDLSYRMIKGGYKNYYFPETQIIHYKGESTKKNSVNYVFVFYRAMVIFAKKHFQKNWKIFRFFIHVAIWIRAALAIISRFFNAVFVSPLSKIKSHHKSKHHGIAIVGNDEEFIRVKSALTHVLSNACQIGFVAYQESERTSGDDYFGNVATMPELIKKLKIDEIIFCASDISSHDIIQMMMSWQHFHVEFKIVPPDADFIIGSNSVYEFHQP